MQVISGVLVMFTAMGMVSMVPAVCRFNQNITCYGTLGEPLHMELPSEEEIKLMKDNSKIFTMKGQHGRTTKLDQTRWQFIPVKRTIIITSTERGDAGRYSLKTFDEGGYAKAKYDLQLNIEAAVSSVEVKAHCFSSEMRTLSCSSEGDQLHFNWTLSGNTNIYELDDGTQTLLLQKDFVGNVTCQVYNHVSYGQTTVLLHQCPVSIMFLCVWVVEIITLLALLGGFHIYIKITNKNKAMESKELFNDKEHQMVDTLYSNLDQEVMQSPIRELS